MPRVNIKTGELIERQEFEGPNPEKQLQIYVEKYLEKFLQCKLLKSFYKIPGGEIDSLALSEDGYPTILEFKHKRGETIINQIVFYYDWLQERSTKFEFERIVQDVLGVEAIEVNWTKVRLICVASEYSKWDISLIKHLDTDIECYSYTYHKDELDIHLDPIVSQYKKNRSIDTSSSGVLGATTLEEHRENADDDAKLIFDTLRDKILELGENVEEGYTTEYVKYFINTTFAAVFVKKKHLVVHLRINNKNFDDPKKISKDISHRNWSTNRELKITNINEVSDVMYLIKQAYDYQ